jgi:dTMP kinase
MLKVGIEGTDGAGKSTGLKYLVEKLKERGLNTIETREVGNPHIPICVKLRETVLAPESNLSGEAMELIFSAMRLENDKWLKLLPDSVDFVVSDRDYFSHLAYTDHNVSELFARDLYQGFMEKYTSMPDIVIYFSVNTETALKRRINRGGVMDVIEMKGIEYQNKVRDSFDKYIKEYDYRNGADSEIMFYSVNANDTIEGVRSQLDEIIDFLSRYAKALRIAKVEDMQGILNQDVIQ